MLNISKKLTIRPMGAEDLEDVLAIERTCYDHPWNADHFRQELAHPLASVDLACDGDAIAGFLCSLYVCGELHINNVATSVAYRRHGVAKQLMKTVLDRARRQGLESAYLEVRAGNEAAISLYRAFGFEVQARRRGYYRDGEDALLMKWVPDAEVDRIK